MDKKDETKAVRSGETGAKYEGAVSLPVFYSSTFVLGSSEEVAAYNKNPESRFFYTRYANPTIDAVEQKIADLEGAELSLLFSSGMAAISTTVLSLLKVGERIVATPSLYGGTRKFFRDVLPKFGVDVQFATGNQLSDVVGLLNSKTKLLYIESPVNPHSALLDVKAFAECAHANRVLSMIDATFATPYLFKPQALGIDLVMHSCTKYMGGHTDLTAGVVSGSRLQMKPVGEYRKTLGGIIDPECAYRLGRGLKTLAVRMEKHCSNALAVAIAAEKSPKVIKVHYPGLTSSESHELAKRQQGGFGGMVCLTLEGGLEKAMLFADSLKFFTNAPSLGSVESLVSLPALTSHVNMSIEEKRMAGVDDGMVRLSVGIESADDLVADVMQALERL